MPPNKKGGKNYKKGKHMDDEPIFYEKQPGQMYGRVIKILGGCNVMVYCNDGKQRLCHIRGSMRKKVWITSGDIVLISTRDLAQEGDKNIERGDVCARYDQRIIYKLREKDPTINEKIFIAIEKSDNPDCIKGPDCDAGFIFESEENEIHNGDSSDSERDERLLPANRAAQKKLMMMTSNDNDDDIDIDDI